jgi:flavin reductase (DIM6/NTAB) family NADH-FMN oxidoreductase RutF
MLRKSTKHCRHSTRYKLRMDRLNTPFRTIDPDVLSFGTPVAVVSTLNPNGTTNLAAMSSFWALGDRFVLGIGSSGQTAANLMRSGECVLNFPHRRNGAMLSGSRLQPDAKCSAAIIARLESTLSRTSLGSPDSRRWHRSA